MTPKTEHKQIMQTTHRVYKKGQRFSAKIHISKAKRKYLEDEMREIKFKRHKNKRAIIPVVWEVLSFLFWYICRSGL